MFAFARWQHGNVHELRHKSFLMHIGTFQKVGGRPGGAPFRLLRDYLPSFLLNSTVSLVHHLEQLDERQK